MLVRDRYWLAGWLEGEGSFRAEVENSKFPRFVITAHSVDKDIPIRAAQIAGYVSGPYGPYSARRQPFWIWQERQRDRVFELIDEIYPLMGMRRQNQINAMRAVADEYPAIYTGTRTVRRRS